MRVDEILIELIILFPPASASTAWDETLIKLPMYFISTSCQQVCVDDTLIKLHILFPQACVLE